MLKIIKYHANCDYDKTDKRPYQRKRKANFRNYISCHLVLDATQQRARQAFELTRSRLVSI